MKKSEVRNPKSEASPKSKIRNGFALAALLLLFATASPLRAAVTFADSVASYTVGTGVLAGYSNSLVALGSPTTSPDYYPFNPPYANSNIVSIGAGGHLTLGFSTPLLNAPGHPYGVDFIIYGHDGFVDTNYPANQTDGVLFSTAYGVPGVSKVFASADGSSFFELRPPPGASATADTLFPTDSIGNVGVPVNPALTNSNFADLDLTGIRALYAGSAGGTGFNLDWAVDTNGLPVVLPSASFVRLDVSANVISIDAISSVVPGPATGALLAAGAVVAVVASRRRR
ncbi:MAG: hypothetical protein HY301_11645 [Verrucomicrobia bacterium]|nr:hypothetical protein [Verrucomicrobiota bacterium]